MVDLYNVLLYVCVALGIPGNILSAIIWLRRHVTGKNSSALYLAVLAINDLVYLLVNTVYNETFEITRQFIWLHRGYDVMNWTTVILESLLVLGFSVERLIAISCPLRVRFIHIDSFGEGLELPMLGVCNLILKVIYQGQIA